MMPPTNRKPLLLLLTLTLAGLVVGLALFVQQARMRHQRSVCANHLREIGKALIIYSNGNSNQLPPSLEYLVSIGQLKLENLICPADEFQSSSSYIYSAGLKQTSRAFVIYASAQSPPLWWVFDQKTNHPAGVHVLTTDGVVRFHSYADDKSGVIPKMFEMTDAGYVADPPQYELFRKLSTMQTKNPSTTQPN